MCVHIVLSVLTLVIVFCSVIIDVKNTKKIQNMVWPTIQLYGCQIGETGASCYNFHSKSLFHKNMQARGFSGRDPVI